MDYGTLIQITVLKISILYGLAKYGSGESFWYNFIKASLTIYIVSAFIIANLIGWLMIAGIVFTGWMFTN